MIKDKKEELNDILSTIESIKDIFSLFNEPHVRTLGSKDYFNKSKRLLKEAGEKLEKDNIPACKKLIEQSKQSAEKERELLIKLKNLSGATLNGGKSTRIHKNLLKELQQGNVESVELMIKDIDKIIEQESIISSKLKEVKSLINKKLAGADLKKAEVFYSSAIEELKKGEFEKSNELAEKSKDSAKPSLWFLLQNAREHFDKALNEYNQKHYVKSKVTWLESKDFYKRALDIANDKKDIDNISNIKEGLRKIDGSIHNSEIALDNQKMFELIVSADEKISKISSLLEKQDYDGALQFILISEKQTREAFKIAETRKFESNRKEIQNRINDLKKRIEYIKLEKGKYLLKNATKYINKNPDKCETELYSVRKYLDSIEEKYKSESFNILNKETNLSIIQSKINQARNKMNEAEARFDNKKYYDARQLYIENEKYVDSINEEARKIKVTNLLDEIKNIRLACLENRNRVEDYIYVREDVPLPDLIRVGPGKQPIDIIKSEPQKLYIDDKVKKLSKYYIIDGRLGGGGFATIYKAMKKGKNKFIALKVYHKITMDNEEVFFKEFENWKKLSHRNIVKLIGRSIDPVPHLIIEYINGVNLYEYKKEKKIDISTACRIVFDVASGIQAAHRKSIIHGDIKPQNILIDSEDELVLAKITDFGTAKTTLTEQIRGLTVPYSAPEQINDNYADEKTDSYQIGLLLYELLTGINPFNEGTRREIEEKIRNLKPDKPSALNRKIKPLDDIITRCLEKNPDKRPDIREIRETLYEFHEKISSKNLILSEDPETALRDKFNSALYYADKSDIDGLILKLKEINKRLRSPEKRKLLEGEIKDIEQMELVGLHLDDDIINHITHILRKCIR